MIIKNDERGLLFKDGNYTKVLKPGKYHFFWPNKYKVDVRDVNLPFESEKDLSVFLEDEELAQLTDQYRTLSMLSDGSPKVVIKSALRTAIEHLGAKQKELERKKSKEKSVDQNNRQIKIPDHKIDEASRASPERVWKVSIQYV